MSTAPGEHPSAEQLALHARGALPAQASAEVDRHVRVCDVCRRRLAQPAAEATVSVVAPAASAPHTGPDIAAVFAGHPRYRIIEPIGAGGMGAVYKAEHTRMERVVALKIIQPRLVQGARAIERFQREVKAAARLNHPNIVTAFDADQVGDTHFLVMEHVNGLSLASYLKMKGALPIAQACAFVRQAALGLQHAHMKGMVHRDIKPANLMLTPHGQVKILDFGLARLTAAQASGPDQGLTEVGSVMGTAEYVAPEQATDPHSADIRADIYSLGCTLYALLTGKPPFSEGSAVQKMVAHMQRQPTPVDEVRRDVPLELGRVVARMLAKDRAQRYQTPAELAGALGPFTGAKHEGREAPRQDGAREPLAAPPTPAASRRAWVLLAGAAALALLVGLAALPWLGSPKAPRADTTTTPPVNAVMPASTPPALAETCLVVNGNWRIDGAELVQDRYDESFLYFGDPSWTDYDFSVEALKVDGSDGLALAFRASDRANGCQFVVGGWDEDHAGHREHVAARLPGAIRPGEWLRLRVRVRGSEAVAFINDEQVVSTRNATQASGGVGLVTCHAPCRFRNFKVTDATGHVLFQGLPSIGQMRLERLRQIVPCAREREITWKYTITKPPLHWYWSDFDDSAWHEGAAPFGCENSPGKRTFWEGNQIWARRSFTLPDVTLADPHLYLSNDNDATVYINGKLAADNLVHIPAGYHKARLSAEARAALRPGKNDIAVHCVDLGGLRFLDVGLCDVTWETCTADPDTDSHPPPRLGNMIWHSAGDELVHPWNIGDSRLFFGAPRWQSYDFTVEARTSRGSDGLALVCGARDQHNFLQALFGGWGNTRHVLQRVEMVKDATDPARDGERTTQLVQSVSGYLQSERWYHLKVEVRGTQCRAYLDGELVSSFTDDKPIRGAVGLICHAPIRFRNLRVASPEGDVLCEGLPALPAPPDTPRTPYPVSGPAPPGVARLDTVMLTALEHPKAEAIALAVANEGRLLYSRGYRWLDRDRQIPAPADILMGATPQVADGLCHAMIRQLARTGKLNLDAPLMSVLAAPPRGKIVDERVKDITLRHVLEETTGWGTDPAARATAMAREEKLPEPLPATALLPFILTQPLASKPGDRHEACGFNQALLRELAVKSAGSRFDDYVCQRLFPPLIVNEFEECQPGASRNPRLAWNAASVGGPFAASAPGLCHYLYRYRPGGVLQNGRSWSGGLLWDWGSTVSLSWRVDRLDVVMMTNGPLKEDYDWGRALHEALDGMRWLWLAGP